MEFVDFFRLLIRFGVTLDAYALENDEVSDSYYQAKVFLSDMGQKCVKDEDYREQVGNWIMKGSTLALKGILSKTEFYEHNLTHFNAFTFLDTVNEKNRKPAVMGVVK